ncbi:MAG: hypothetical protein MUC67_13125 [Acidobacteria bacterium]|nr:hypothetical protein [Acidobacteriota bacterium]
MPTYYTLHVCGDRGPVSLTASAYVARLDADGGLFLEAESLRACLASVPQVTHIYCKSEALPLDDPIVRFTLTRSAEEPGRLSLTTYAAGRPRATETVGAPWGAAFLAALRGLPECAAALREAADRSRGQMAWLGPQAATA